MQFAGMQCQIQFSDHVETKHKPGFIEYLLPFLIRFSLSLLCSGRNSRAVLNSSFYYSAEYEKLVTFFGRIQMNCK